MKLQTLQILQFFIECRIMVGGASVHISKHSLFRLKITVSCQLCACPSIHLSLEEDTLKITVGCLTSTYRSIRNKNLHTCCTPWSTQETRGLWARPPVLTPVPVQAIHSRACLNLHHCDIQSTAQKSHCVNMFLRPSSRKKTKTFLSLSGSLGKTHRTKTTDT